MNHGSASHCLTDKRNNITSEESVQQRKYNQHEEEAWGSSGLHKQDWEDKQHSRWCHQKLEEAAAERWHSSWNHKIQRGEDGWYSYRYNSAMKTSRREKKIANYKKCRKNFIRKNILTTVAIITTKGWDLPNKVTSHKRQQQPESFIPRVIQCSWCLKAGHTRTSCQCIQSAVIAQRHTATMNAPCPSKIRTIASHLLIENVPTVLEHMGPQIPRLPIPSTM